MTTATMDPRGMSLALARRPPIDTESAPYVGLSALLHALLLLFVMVVPPGAATMELDGLAQRDTFASIAAIPEAAPPREVHMQPSRDEGTDAAAGHKGDEGAAGSPDAAPSHKRVAIERAPDNADPRLRHARDKAVAANAGVIAAFGGTSTAKMWGASGDSVGSEANNALNHMGGADVGPTEGTGGLGVRGTGRGGPGDDESFGLARVHTHGRGGGERDRHHRPGLGDHRQKLPEPVPGRPIIDGGLDRKIIRRVVRQHRRELGFCYQKELQSHPSLSGRVVMKFTISGDGAVIAALARQNTMNSPAVAACLSNKIRHWHFPAPTGGGLVTVNYPFRFSRE